MFRQEKYREALDAFREALQKRPGDHDARHNYELTLRKLEGGKDQEQKPPPQPPPSPQNNPNAGGGGGGGGGGGANPPPTPPRGSTSPQGGNAPPPSGGANGQLSRAEAERLLDALSDGERQARAAQKRSQQAGEARKEKDW